ncbi:MAG: hypothetical protein ACP5QT_03030 [Brevinematia bacterium]
MIKYRVTLTPLTAIHIGTGNKVELFEYTVKDDFYHRFSLEKVISSIPKNENLFELIEKTDVKELAKLFHKYVNDENIIIQSAGN